MGGREMMLGRSVADKDSEAGAGSKGVLKCVLASSAMVVGRMVVYRCS